MKYFGFLRTIVALSVLMCGTAIAQVTITVNPEISVSIDGHLDFARSQFINLGAPGNRVETTVQNPSWVTKYTNSWDMKFGRELGGVGSITASWGNPGAVIEDTARLGYIDLLHLSTNLTASTGGASSNYINHYSPNLGRATHDRADAYPSWMGLYTDGGGHTHPNNAAAAAELAVGVLEYHYNGWTRPATYEIVNEPHYSVWGDQRFANHHTAVKNRVADRGLNVAIGGPCMSVSYFYKDNYQNGDMNGLESFIDNTGCNLDFYSFHTYDFMSWDAAKTDFVGRVTTGLPLEGVLDMIQNYTINTHGKNVDVVLSEHGGYISQNGSATLDMIANTYFPGSGWEWQMKRASVAEFIAVSSMIANTMTFMNNPHVVRKGVPFILLETAGWNPAYGNALIVKENYDKNNPNWHETSFTNFFEFFQGVSGRRVQTQMNDPDIQCQSYVDNNKMYILLNNLDDQAETLNLNIPTNSLQNITLRRFGRKPDFTPYFTTSNQGSISNLTIAGREAISIVVDYASVQTEIKQLNEVPYYGDLIQQSFSGNETFTVNMPEYEQAQAAILRIGVGRGAGTDQQINVSFNGTVLIVPLEDCADYLESSSTYGTTKLINVPTNLLKAVNNVEVSFPSDSGGIGAVVIRAALDPDIPISPPPAEIFYDSFESGWENWTNVSGDTHDWFLDHGGTPSSGTGPSSGATGTTWYAYLETTSTGGGAFNSGDTAILESPSMTNSRNRTLTFCYHMYGSSMGSLYVDVFSDGSWQSNVWSRSGQQHSSSVEAYSEASVDLSGYTGTIKLRLRGVAAGGFRGDMAIDEIRVFGNITTNNTPTGYDQWADGHAIPGAAHQADNDLDGESNLAEYIFGGNPTNPSILGYQPVLNKSMQYVYVIADDPLISHQVLMSTNLIETSFDMTNITYLGSNTFGGGLLIHSNTVDTAGENLFLKLEAEYTQ